MQSIAEAIVKVYYGNLTMIPDTSRVFACLHEKDVKFKFLNMNKGNQPMTVDFIKLQEKALKRAGPAYEDGTTMLFDSREICRYVSEKYADQGNKYLLGKDLLERASIEQWLRSEEHSFDPPSWALVFHLVIAPILKLNPNTELIQESQRKLSEILDVYNQRLGESKYLAGNEFTLADLSHLPNSHYLANSKEWSYLFNERKNVKKWLKRISERRSWIEAVRKRDEAYQAYCELWLSTSASAAVEDTDNKLKPLKPAKSKGKMNSTFPSKTTDLPSKHESDQPSEPPLKEAPEQEQMLMVETDGTRPSEDIPLVPQTSLHPTFHPSEEEPLQSSNQMPDRNIRQREKDRPAKPLMEKPKGPTLDTSEANKAKAIPPSQPPTPTSKNKPEVQSDFFPEMEIPISHEQQTEPDMANLEVIQLTDQDVDNQQRPTSQYIVAPLLDRQSSKPPSETSHGKKVQGQLLRTSVEKPKDRSPESSMYMNTIHQQQPETVILDPNPSQHLQIEIEESPKTTSQDIPSLPPTQSKGHQYPDAPSYHKGKSKSADLAQGAIPKKPELQPIELSDRREAKPIDRNTGTSEGETEDDSEPQMQSIGQLPKTTEPAEKIVGKKASARGGTTGTPTTESENNRAFTTASEAPRSAEKTKEVPKPAVVCDQPTELPVSSDVSEKEDKTEINTATAPVDTVHLAQAKQVKPSKSTVTSDTTKNDITGPTQKIEITKEVTAAGLTQDKALEPNKMRGKAPDVKPSTPKPTEASTQPKLPSNAGISKIEIPTPAQKTDSTTRPTALDGAHYALAKKTDPSKSLVTSDNSNKEVSGPAQKSETTKAPTSAAELTEVKVARPTKTPVDTLNIVTPSPEPAKEDREVSGPAKPPIQLQPSEQSTDSDISKQKGATPAQEADIITGPTPPDLTYLAEEKHAHPQTSRSPVISETTKKEVTGPAQKTEITTGPTSAADLTKEKAPRPTKIPADTLNIKPSTLKPEKEATEVRKPSKPSIQPSESSKSSDLSKEDTRSSQGTEANLVEVKANESSKSPTTSDTSGKVHGSVPETEMPKRPTSVEAVDLTREKAPQPSKTPTNSDTSKSKLSQAPQRPEGKVETPRPLEPADRPSPESEASLPSGTPTGSSSQKAQEPKPAETSTNERGIQTPKSSPLSKKQQGPMDSGNKTMEDTGTTKKLKPLEQDMSHEIKETEQGVPETKLSKSAKDSPSNREASQPTQSSLRGTVSQTSLEKTRQGLELPKPPKDPSHNIESSKDKSTEKMHTSTTADPIAKQNLEPEPRQPSKSSDFSTPKSQVQPKRGPKVEVRGEDPILNPQTEVHNVEQKLKETKGSQPYEKTTASPTQKPAHQQDVLISGDKPTETASSRPASQLPRSSANTHTSKGKITQPAKGPTEAIASQTYPDKTSETLKPSKSPKAHGNKEDPSKYSDKTKGKMDTATSSEPTAGPGSAPKPSNAIKSAQKSKSQPMEYPKDGKRGQIQEEAFASDRQAEVSNVEQGSTESRGNQLFEKPAGLPSRDLHQLPSSDGKKTEPTSTPPASQPSNMGKAEATKPARSPTARTTRQTSSDKNTENFKPSKGVEDEYTIKEEPSKHVDKSKAYTESSVTSEPVDRSSSQSQAPQPSKTTYFSRQNDVLLPTEDLKNNIRGKTQGEAPITSIQPEFLNEDQTSTETKDEQKSPAIGGQYDQATESAGPTSGKQTSETFQPSQTLTGLPSEDKSPQEEKKTAKRQTPPTSQPVLTTSSQSQAPKPSLKSPATKSQPEHSQEEAPISNHQAEAPEATKSQPERSQEEAPISNLQAEVPEGTKSLGSSTIKGQLSHQNPENLHPATLTDTSKTAETKITSEKAKRPDSHPQSPQLSDMTDSSVQKSQPIQPSRGSTNEVKVQNLVEDHVTGPEGEALNSSSRAEAPSIAERSTEITAASPVQQDAPVSDGKNTKPTGTELKAGKLEPLQSIPESKNETGSPTTAGLRQATKHSESATEKGAVSSKQEKKAPEPDPNKKGTTTTSVESASSTTEKQAPESPTDTGNSKLEPSKVMQSTENMQKSNLKTSKQPDVPQTSTEETDASDNQTKAPMHRKSPKEKLEAPPESVSTTATWPQISPTTKQSKEQIDIKIGPSKPKEPTVETGTSDATTGEHSHVPTPLQKDPQPSVPPITPGVQQTQPQLPTEPDKRTTQESTDRNSLAPPSQAPLHTETQAPIPPIKTTNGKRESSKATEQSTEAPNSSPPVDDPNIAEGQTETVASQPQQDVPPDSGETSSEKDKGASLTESAQHTENQTPEETQGEASVSNTQPNFLDVDRRHAETKEEERSTTTPGQYHQLAESTGATSVDQTSETLQPSERSTGLSSSNQEASQAEKTKREISTISQQVLTTSSQSQVSQPLPAKNRNDEVTVQDQREAPISGSKVELPTSSPQAEATSPEERSTKTTHNRLQQDGPATGEVSITKSTEETRSTMAPGLEQATQPTESTTEKGAFTSKQEEALSPGDKDTGTNSIESASSPAENQARDPPPADISNSEVESSKATQRSMDKTGEVVSRDSKSNLKPVTQLEAPQTTIKETPMGMPNQKLEGPAKTSPVQQENIQSSKPVPEELTNTKPEKTRENTGASDPNVVEPSSVPTPQQKDPQTTITEPTPSEQETQAKNHDPEEVPTLKQKSTEQVTNKTSVAPPPEVSQKQVSSESQKNTSEETTVKTSEVSSPTETPQPDGSRSPTTDFPKSVQEDQTTNDPKSSTD